MMVISIVYAAVLVWVSAVAQHVGNMRSPGGMNYVSSDRSEAAPDGAFVGRAGRALRNNMESALMYVPIALVAAVLGRSSTVVTGAATVYVIVRTTFTLGYWLKINTLRSLSWAVGMIAVAVLALAVLI